VLAAYKLSLDLLFGNISGEEEVRERGALIGRAIDLPRYALVIIEPDARYYERLSFEQREYIRYRALEIAEAHFVGRCNTAAANVPMDHVVLILNFRGDGNVRSRIDDLLMNLRTEIGLDQNIVVSDMAEHPADVRQLYERARERLGYRFLLGYGNVLTPESVGAIEETSAAFPFDALRQYEVLLRAGRYDELKEELKVLFDAVAACRYSLPIVWTIRYEIVNVIVWMSEEQRLKTPELGKHRLLAESREISFLPAWREWIFHVIDVYSRNCSLRRTAVKDEFLDRITEYIRSHLDHELSLQSVASAFSVSQSHLSRLFKQGEGINFREFVLSAKIARARDLLTDETDLTVTEIARSLGYHDLAYFARLFREHCGMTPSEYRRAYAEYGVKPAGTRVDDRG
jgi:AraC-like DNA-binding protein